MEYNLTVNDAYVRLMHRAVCFYLDQWSGGDPEEQQAYMEMKRHMDKLMLETMFDCL